MNRLFVVGIREPCPRYEPPDVNIDCRSIYPNEDPGIIDGLEPDTVNRKQFLRVAWDREPFRELRLRLYTLTR